MQPSPHFAIQRPSFVKSFLAALAAWAVVVIPLFLLFKFAPSVPSGFLSRADSTADIGALIMFLFLATVVGWPLLFQMFFERITGAQLTFWGALGAVSAGVLAPLFALLGTVAMTFMLMSATMESENMGSESTGDGSGSGLARIIFSLLPLIIQLLMMARVSQQSSILSVGQGLQGIVGTNPQPAPEEFPLTPQAYDPRANQHPSPQGYAPAPTNHVPIPPPYQPHLDSAHQGARTIQPATPTPPHHQAPVSPPHPPRPQQQQPGQHPQPPRPHPPMPGQRPTSPQPRPAAPGDYPPQRPPIPPHHQQRPPQPPPA